MKKEKQRRKNQEIFHLNRARPARCSVPALLFCLQKSCLLALQIIFLGLLAGAKQSCNHRDTLSCMKKLFEISRKKNVTLRKLIAWPFSDCFPPLVVTIHLNIQDYQNLVYSDVARLLSSLLLTPNLTHFH